MSLRFRNRGRGAARPPGGLSRQVLLLVTSGILVGAIAAPLPRRSAPLRVCADPNNLPFSNQRGEGLENRLAELIARELKTSVSYRWWPQRRGFIRNTLAAGQCDVVMGVPSDLPSVLTTCPYYRSRYVFVSRADRNIVVRSFDDPRLRRLRIGVQVVGDGANTPPMDAFARRGITKNLVGYTVFGDYAQPNPPARIVEAVSRGDVDVAVVWGPLAGFFADKYAVPLTLSPVPDDGRLPFEFAISLAVRKGDEARRAALDRLLVSRRAEIENILDQYHVPRADGDLSTRGRAL
jgi:mxaJ protein